LIAENGKIMLKCPFEFNKFNKRKQMTTKPVSLSHTTATFFASISDNPLASRAHEIQKLAEQTISTGEALNAMQCANPEDRQIMKDSFDTAKILGMVPADKMLEVHVYMKEHGLDAACKKYSIIRA
jgi:hypothetical protein